VEQRRQIDVTQAQPAEVLGFSKARISSLERQEDLRISTLHDYVEALGGHLEIDAVFGEDRINLDGANAA
jgi:DNA-binding XRE family transcriptional regulator